MKTHIIENNTLVNTVLASVAEVQRLFPDAVCVDASKYSGAIGDHWDDRQFVAPTPKLSEIVAAKRAQIISDFHNTVSAIRAGYTDEEIETWDKQALQAAEYLAGNAVVGVFLSNQAESRGVSVADMADLIHKKAQKYEEIYGAALGVMQRRLKLLAEIDLSGVDAAEKIENV